MVLSGSIVVVASSVSDDLTALLTQAGAFPVVGTPWAGAAEAVRSIVPDLVLITTIEAPDDACAAALADEIAQADHVLPVVAVTAPDRMPVLPGALTIAPDATPERLLARLSSAARLRTLHATVLRRAEGLERERGVLVNLPDGDPLDEATALVIGRGRSHLDLTQAMGERCIVVGAFSVEAVARCLHARDIDGVIIGDGIGARASAVLLDALAEDGAFRDLPVGMLGTGLVRDDLPNFVRDTDVETLVSRLAPLVQLRAFEARLKRTLAAIEHMGCLDPHTGLMSTASFRQELTVAIEDGVRRGDRLSVARLRFGDAAGRRATLDVARLAGRLMRDVDFACCQPDGSILVAFTRTDLQAAHVAARRLAVYLHQTMLRPNNGLPAATPDVTLATLRTGDTPDSLLARIAEPVVLQRASA